MWLSTPSKYICEHKKLAKFGEITLLYKKAEKEFGKLTFGNSEFSKCKTWSSLLSYELGIYKFITVFYRVYCAYKYCVHLNFTMIFGKNFYFFIFHNYISQELIIASLFIIKTILNPSSATFHV